MYNLYLFHAKIMLMEPKVLQYTIKYNRRIIMII